MQSENLSMNNTLIVYQFGKSVLFATTIVFINCFHLANAQPVTILPELPTYESTRQFTITESDSIIYDVNLAVAGDGLPLYFYRNVFTPVCYTEVCKPVYIDVYWDLLGNYLGFQVPAHEPLTKTDHKEFEAKDYDQLHKILFNTESILQDFKIYELVDTRTYNLSDSVDAVTGATPKTIKNEVIGGAVYTCFTLWHIVNGPVKQALKDITEAHYETVVLPQFLSSNNHHYQYWAIDKSVSHQKTIASFLPQVMDIIRGGNIFTARYAIEKLPAYVFNSSDTLQSWLWLVYKQSSYTLQSAILKKLKQIEISEALALSLSRELPNTNEEQFSSMVALLTNRQTLSVDTITELAKHLDSFDAYRASAIYKVLLKRDVSDGDVRRKMKRFEKSTLHLN